MGRCFRRDARASRRLRPRAHSRYADQRGRIRRRGRRRGPHGFASDRRTDVRRLRRRVSRPDHESDREVPVHVRRSRQDAARDSRDVRRRHALGRAAHAGVLSDLHAHSRPQGRDPVESVRRERPAAPGDPRRRSGDLPRKQDAVRHRGRSARRRIHDSVRRGAGGAGRERRADRCARPHGRRGGDGRSPPRGRRRVGMHHRSAHDVAARRGHAARIHRGHRTGRDRRRGESALQRRDGYLRAAGRQVLRLAEGADPARDGAAHAGAVCTEPGRRVRAVAGSRRECRQVDSEGVINHVVH
ncbi:hypothetical protein F01_460586 [Burkholderia cenocepacia]|nr:hypothetical protein F01_460586 [Burkholderia cenocepacia]